MSREEISLEEAYIVEPVLSADKVEFYYSMGKQELLKRIRKNKRDPIQVNLCVYEGEIVPKIINGCHRSKALYKHGIRTIEAEVENDRRGLAVILLKLSEDSVKLTNALELNVKQHEQFLEKFQSS